MMFFNKNKNIILSQERKINELQRRLWVAMPENCRHENHDWFVMDEYIEIDVRYGVVDSWTVRKLECKNCGKRITDDNKYGCFMYNSKETKSSTCSVAGCDTKVHCKGLCKKHYDKGRKR